MTRPNDETLSCSDIATQVADNMSEIQKFQTADRQVESGNAVKAVGTAVPVLGLAAAASIDLSNAEQVKARSILDRNDRLKMLARSKGCSSL